MLNCFHADLQPGQLVLTKEESHHLVAVRRARAGETVRVLDGQGGSGLGQVVRADAKAAIIQIPAVERAQLHTPPIWLLQALPKGKTMDLIVQKASELGAHGIVPLFTRYSESHLDASRSARKTEKWEDIALESLKQCGNPWLPRIFPPMHIREIGGLPLPEVRLVASLEPDAMRFGAALEEGAASPGAVVAIGPEGDFSSEEYALLKDMHFRPVTLGVNVLRAETAAIAALALAGEFLRVK